MPLKDLEARRIYVHNHHLKNRERHNQRHHQRYVENREVLISKQQAYDSTRKPLKAAYDKVHSAKNRDKIRKRKAAHRAAHPTEAKARQRKHYLAHREEVLAKNAIYVKTHPEVIQVRSARRRSHKTNAPMNDLTTAQWREIKEHYGHRCVYCDRQMQRLTMDHITPLSLGGPHTASNVVPACTSCNSSKRNGPPLCPVQPLLLTIAPAKKTLAS